jgi:hypothetical protein
MPDPLGIYRQAPTRSKEFEAKSLIYNGLMTVYKQVVIFLGEDKARNFMLKELKGFILKMEGKI